jgi:hypothetical protein
LNRLRIYAIVVSLTVFLSGCQADQKQVDKIYNILRESTAFEKQFVTNLKDLSQTREKAQTVYTELIHLDIDDQENVSQKIDAFHTFTNEQQRLLVVAEENFQKAYQQAVTIEKPIKKMKNKDQKNKASQLMKIINERKILMDTFFDAYYESLELQNTFFQQLEDETFQYENLNEQINAINKRMQDIGEIIQQFNQYTQQFIEVENDLYLSIE